MPIVNRIAEFAEDMTAWRRDIHRHPEIAFEEHRTAEVVAGKLADWGIEVHRGLAGTGVVGLLEGRKAGARMIGLRADMDALPLQELNGFDHRSVHDGKMHACGHDGHTAMLLGAARYLAETRNFAGRIAFIFQPAEEGEGGARVMIEEGLFERFPVESVYGLHNMPGLDRGQVALRAGPLLAAADTVTIEITGKGGHAAIPHMAIDPVVIGAEIVMALQTIASRRIDPLDSLVISVTRFDAGTADNIIPETARLTGSVRTLKTETRDQVEAEIRRVADGIAAAHGGTAEVTFSHGYPATVNWPEETARCAEVAGEIVGPENVHGEVAPVMGSEDFAFMLEKKPGCYILLGNGLEGGPGGCSVHNPNYDFNDEVAVIGASYWARLAETLLAE
jgi:hippurate hydrolase